MKLSEMDFWELRKAFRSKQVTITRKSGATVTGFLYEIENQDDGWDDVVFMVETSKTGGEDVYLADAKQIDVIQ
ncbi:hypothetical protein [Lacticaseibacillus saniviri]|uniref:hypothetical protein n=1 Tax=Lacticaseibacillus saniviri TaxID=931533 RepID=UPI001EE088DC|nr:hypothetical protein [Lacticaseibacillus saniviri]MCG4280850.1 hypothetical protein [Lacticaseibacillus saniviri]